MYKISVLVPVYGVEKYIEKCAESLFSNTYADKCEFIFLNDCTKDNSIDILKNVIKKYPNLHENIKLINHEENKGLAGARQTLMENASGEYFICVDSDDWVESNYLEEFYLKAVETNADLISCGYYKEVENASKPKIQYFSDDKEDNLKRFVSDKIFAYLWTKLIKRSIFIDNNIKWKTGINMYEDLYVMIQAILKCNYFCNIDKHLYHYRFVSSGSSSIVHKVNIRKYQDMFYVLSFVKNILEKENLFNLCKEDFFCRIINIKFDFSLEFIPFFSSYKNHFTKSQINYSMSLYNEHTHLRKVFFKLIYKNLFFLLPPILIYRNLKNHSNFGFINYNKKEMKFIYTFDNL